MGPIPSSPIIRHLSKMATLILVACLVILAAPCSYGVSKLKQKNVPADVSEVNAAILETNDAFITFMTERSVRTVAKGSIEVTNLDEPGDQEFVRENRGKNGDYWYWAHQKAQAALVLAVGNAPLEAIRAIDLIPYSEALIAEYRWVTEPEFRAYLESANEDLLYYFDPYIAIEVFLTNFQVSKLDRSYPTVSIPGERRRQNIQTSIPILEISIQKLVATPRPGEEGEVGLEAILNLPGGGVTEPLLPSSKEFQQRRAPIAEKLTTAADFQLKTIPVGTLEAKDLLQPFMGKDMKFLMIQGSMRVSATKGTDFSDDLKIVVNPESDLTTFLDLHQGAFAKANVHRAE